MVLPALPSISLRQEEDLTPEAPAGFLRLRRRRLRAVYADGSTSEPFVHDCVDRDALDAVVIAAHYRQGADRWVYLRSALRPALALRPNERRPLPERDDLGLLWELPAGLVERDEYSPQGLLRCAARELHEELGFEVPADRLRALGRATFPAAGIVGERHYYFEVEVVPAERGEPLEDGSVLERNALVVARPLVEALAAARDGGVEDAKTELGLRRLAEI